MCGGGETAEKVIKEFIRRYDYDPDLVLPNDVVDKWWKIKRVIARDLGEKLERRNIEDDEEVR